MRNMIRSAAIVAATAVALPASALNILLTNDDGYGTYGIEKMEQELSAAGHNVYVAAPAAEQSGKSGSVTTDTRAIIKFTEEVTGKEWSIGTKDDPDTDTDEANPATPADSVNAGLYALTPDVLPAGESIDLVISGVNDGENISRFSNASGTVGAAMWALRRGVPAIAVSVGQDIGTLRAIRDCPPPPAGYSCILPLLETARLNAEAGADTAVDFTLSVLNELSEDGLPQGLGLSINVPSGAFTPLATRVTRSDNQQAFDLVMGKTADGDLQVDGESSNEILAALVSGFINPYACLTPGALPIPIDFDSEGVAFSCANITVSIFDGNFDASQDKHPQLRELACSLKGLAEMPSFVKCNNGKGNGNNNVNGNK